MSARSSLVFLLLGGCDLAFGVGGDPDPCELASFDKARSTDINMASTFSVDWDQRFAVVDLNTGLFAELDLPAGTSRLIDLGPSSPLSLALSPEGSALLYTTGGEPPILEGALRGEPGMWKLGARVPTATFVGTTSADVFGPRRALARIRPFDTELQELEDDNGTWVPVGDPHPFEGQSAPNLTPNGLTAVFAVRTPTETSFTSEIYGMTRASTAEWFGAPVKILANDKDSAPQLLGHCERLYTIHDENMMRRYDR